MSDRQHGKVHTHGSRTAELLAVSRARHLLRHRPPYIFHDPFTIHFVGERWQRVLRSNLRDALVSRVLLRKLMPMTTQPLTRDAIEETLNHVAQVASPGSEIVFDYLAGTKFIPETK